MICISHHPKWSSFYLQMTHVYFTHIRISIFYRFVKQQLNHLLKANKLTLNIDKSSFIKFGWYRDCNNENKLAIQIEDEKLQQKHFAKYLGSYFDNNLSRKIKNTLRNDKFQQMKDLEYWGKCMTSYKKNNWKIFKIHLH